MKNKKKAFSELLPGRKAEKLRILEGHFIGYFSPTSMAGIERRLREREFQESRIDSLGGRRRAAVSLKLFLTR